MVLLELLCMQREHFNAVFITHTISSYKKFIAQSQSGELFFGIYDYTIVMELDIIVLFTKGTYSV